MKSADSMHVLAYPCSSSKLKKKEYSALRKSYIDVASHMTKRDVMTLFRDATKKQLRKPQSLRKRQLAKLIDELRDILGDRLLVLGEKWDCMVSGKRIAHTVRHIRKKMEQRSFIVDRDTPIFCYGEHMDACVSGVAEKLRKHGRFREKTVVFTAYGNWHDLSEKELFAAVEKARHSWSWSRKHFVYDIERQKRKKQCA